MIALLSFKTKIVTPLLEETRDWYRSLFGLEVLEEWERPGDRGCILGLSGSGDLAFLEIYHGEKSVDFSGVSLQFRVKDIDQFQVPDEARFAFSGPVDRPWDSRYIFFTDPNGIAVVVFSGTAL